MIGSLLVENHRSTLESSTQLGYDIRLLCNESPFSSCRLCAEQAWTDSLIVLPAYIPTNSVFTITNHPDQSESVGFGTWWNCPAIDASLIQTEKYTHLSSDTLSFGRSFPIPVVQRQALPWLVRYPFTTNLPFTATHPMLYFFAILGQNVNSSPIRTEEYIHQSSNTFSFERPFRSRLFKDKLYRGLCSDVLSLRPMYLLRLLIQRYASLPDLDRMIGNIFETRIAGMSCHGGCHPYTAPLNHRCVSRSTTEHTNIFWVNSSAPHS
jgi:hypothetical protein